MSEETQVLVNRFENAFGSPKDALHQLANQHEMLPLGVIEYWEEKLSAINHDVQMLKELAKQNKGEKRYRLCEN